MAAKILVVDDEPDVREILTQSLAMEGYDVTVAVDGRDAINQFKIQAADLVITDMRMPKADGLDVLQAVKVHDPLAEVIVLTGYGTLKNAIAALKNEGAFHYLTKPLEDIEEFLTTVRNALERRLLRRQNQSLLDKLREKNRFLEEKSGAADAARIELEEALERYTSLVNAIPSGVIEVDTRGVIKFANTASHKLFGIPPGKLAGRSIYDLMPDEAQRADLKQYFETLAASTPAPTPKITRGRTARGDVLDLQVNWNYQRSGDGSLAGFIAVLTNITAQKHASEERLLLEKHLATAQKKEAISTLAGGIAHRFNNALAAVVGNLELLELSTEGDPKVSAYTERIMDQTQEMALQTQKLLAYAEGGKYRSKHLDIGVFIKENLPIIRFGLEEERDIQYRVDEAPIDIKADPTQLELMLSALVQNAAEATDTDGSILIAATKVASPPANLPELTPGPYAHLCITDDGRGMDTETLDHLFEPYFSTKFEGRGLGMAAVQGIIENHAGGISVTSSVDGGTSIEVFLPLVETPATEPQAIPVEVSMEGYRLLIIEDEPALLKACEAMLTDLGCQVWSAPTAESGIQQLKAHQEEIDLVLMDLILPDMGAMALFKALRGIRADIRVVLCSGYNLDGPAQDIIDAGALAFLQKPYSTKALIASLRRASVADLHDG